MKHKNKLIKAISVGSVSLLLAASLSGCSLLGLTTSGIIGGTLEDDIRIETPDSSSSADTSSSTLGGDIQIVDPGVLELKENPQVTDNQTEFTKTVAKAASSVVEIDTETTSYGWGGQYIQPGAGSGVIIAHNEKKSVYYIVTNHHVIDSAETILVRLSDGTEYQNVQLIATDMLTDVALLAISAAEGTELSCATFMNAESTLADGQDVFVVGNPLGELGGSVTKGIVSKTERFINVDGIIMRLLQIDASVNPGNSGGALFDMSGNLIGIVNAKYLDESVEGIGFAIPINTVRTVVQQLAENGYVGGRAGVDFETADKTYSSGSIFNSTTVTYPTVVADTSFSGSYTDDSGKNATFTFKKGDIIAAVNGSTVNSSAGLLSLLSLFEIGDSAELTVIRNVTETKNGRVVTTSKEYKVTVTLVEYIPTNN